ncbi:MAG: GNAT family N-acetyltransferase [Acholeplasmataceae bacterium]|nr:GNAT family N-acetyltransferase [Acholeplasmataceae bacterium]
MEPTDSALSVASLIYDTEEDLFRFLFGPRTKALKRLSRLILMRNHAFSYERIKVLEKGDDIVGILIESNPRKQTDDNEAFMKGFGVLGLIGLLFKMILLFPLLNESGIKGRYIQNVSVSKTHRGMGLGSKLLDDAIRRAKEDQVQTLTLDVNIKNERARALYERKGFVIRKTRRIWGIFKVTYRMDLDLNEHPGISQDT